MPLTVEVFEHLCTQDPSIGQGCGEVVGKVGASVWKIRKYVIKDGDKIKRQFKTHAEAEKALAKMEHNG